MNYGIFIGNLADDAKIRQGQDGKAFGTLNLIVSEGYGDKKTSIPISGTHGYPTENLYKFLKKGQKVAIRGNIKPDGYTSKSTGELVYIIKISIDNIELVGAPQSQGNGFDNGNNAPFSQPRQSAPAPAPQHQAQARQQIVEKAKMMEAAGLIENDDLPF